ncbi:MAG: hypothetical protein AAGB29_01545 [Planctomycetota bacterium]
MSQPAVIADGIEGMVVRPALDPAGHRTPLVHIGWRRADHAVDAAVQVYVDDELVAVVFDPQADETWLSLDPHGDQRIDLQAVKASPADEAWTSRPPSQDRPTDRIDVQMVRETSLPIDTRVSLAVNGVPAASGPMWGPDDVRGGFGSLFGIGSFGADAAAAVGLGLGPLGTDALDIDETPLRFRWAPPDLPLGPTEITASFIDARGREVATDSRIDLVTDRLARSVDGLRLENDTLVWNA